MHYGMARDEFEIRHLLEDGISVSASADDFDEFELRRLVEAAKEGGTVLTVSESDSLDEYEIRRIAEEGKRHVVFR
jgi:hypothetical protein